jgi:GxxExxY protein
MKEEEINKLTGGIIGCAIKVHKAIGPGFVEKIYEKALIYEFEKATIDFRNQLQLKIKYEDIEIGRQRVDFIIEDTVLLELKSASRIIPVFEAQLLSYMKASGKRVGLLLNFGRKRIEIRRMVNRL